MEYTLGKTPILREIKKIGETDNPNPIFYFTSNLAGVITFIGDCVSNNKDAVEGENAIELATLNVGIYDNCSIKITTPAGNVSETLNITAFTIIIKFDSKNLY